MFILRASDHWRSALTSSGWSFWRDTCRRQSLMQQSLARLRSTGLTRGLFTWHDSSIEAKERIDAMRRASARLLSAGLSLGWSRLLEAGRRNATMRVGSSRWPSIGMARGWRMWTTYKSAPGRWVTKYWIHCGLISGLRSWLQNLEETKRRRHLVFVSTEYWTSHATAEGWCSIREASETKDVIRNVTSQMATLQDRRESYCLAEGWVTWRELMKAAPLRGTMLEKAYKQWAYGRCTRAWRAWCDALDLVKRDMTLVGMAHRFVDQMEERGCVQAWKAWCEMVQASLLRKTLFGQAYDQWANRGCKPAWRAWCEAVELRLSEKAMLEKGHHEWAILGLLDGFLSWRAMIIEDKRQRNISNRIRIQMALRTAASVNDCWTTWCELIELNRVRKMLSLLSTRHQLLDYLQRWARLARALAATSLTIDVTPQKPEPEVMKAASPPAPSPPKPKVEPKRATSPPAAAAEPPQQRGRAVATARPKDPSPDAPSRPVAAARPKDPSPDAPTRPVAAARPAAAAKKSEEVRPQKSPAKSPPKTPAKKTAPKKKAKEEPSRAPPPASSEAKPPPEPPSEQLPPPPTAPPPTPPPPDESLTKVAEEYWVQHGAFRRGIRALLANREERDYERSLDAISQRARLQSGWRRWLQLSVEQYRQFGFWQQAVLYWRGVELERTWHAFELAAREAREEAAKEAREEAVKEEDTETGLSVAELQAKFKSIDTDGDGKISRQEWSEATAADSTLLGEDERPGKEELAARRKVFERQNSDGLPPIDESTPTRRAVPKRPPSVASSDGLPPSDEDSDAGEPWNPWPWK